MDGADVVEIGTILSLVEADGTIVIRGASGKPPLNEGSVLSAVAGDPEVRGRFPFWQRETRVSWLLVGVSLSLCVLPVIEKKCIDTFVREGVLS